ncbi:MAG: thiamine pyrophosphate-dependent enzyme [bacterium]
MADTEYHIGTQDLPLTRRVNQIPEKAVEEYYTSGHRTCQGCESALIMRLMAKAAGPRSIILGSTGCMYVANTTYYSTPWVVPWMHTQLGSAGSAATGTAAALRALMRKGKIKEEPINVIAFCGDGGGADMGVSSISAALMHTRYNLLIICYDNESYANTDIQISGASPWGANTTFTPPGKKVRIMHKNWKKNIAALYAVGHTKCNYVATGDASYPADLIDKVRKGLKEPGPAFIHTLDPCPKGWDYDPFYSHKLGELAVESGLFPLWEMTNGELTYTGTSARQVYGNRPRKPVREYLETQGRFHHFIDEDFEYFQGEVDKMWNDWAMPGVIPFKLGEDPSKKK